MNIIYRGGIMEILTVFKNNLQGIVIYDPYHDF